MTKKKKQKVVMPAGIRSKMMSATAMLLVAAILMVSTTYAWFTLSTAPEVTGITTQVGANGNLEIALLTTATYSDTSLISSAVGDSSAATSSSVTKANITWGNLLDLSDSSYGLSTISLMPAALSTNSNGNVNVGTPLETAEYGADGRVTETKANTTTAIMSSNSFEINGTSQDYGVRAVGTSNELTERELGLRNAKALFNTNMNLAKSKAQSTISDTDNLGGLVSLATAAQGVTDTSTIQISDADATSLYNVAVGLQTSLKYVEAAYKQAVLAYIAYNSALTDEQYTAAVSVINGASSLSALSSYAGSMASELTNLQNALDNAATAVNNLSAYTSSGGSYNDVKAAAEPILKSGCYERNGFNLTIVNAGTTGAAAGSCTLGDVADYVGTYSYTIGGVGGVTINPNGGTAKLDTISIALTGYTAAGTTASATTKITDTYGYILDFAVRTNAASSNLLLQTTATQRVYDDSNSTATQGSGSNLTLSYTAGLTKEQATKILGAIRVVFMNPEDGEIYATAVASNIEAGSDSAKADLVLIKSSTSTTVTYTVLGKDAYTLNNGTYTLDTTTYPAATETITYKNYAEVIDADAYKALNATTTVTKTTSTAIETAEKQSAITELQQNTVKKVSTLVYMDGDSIDNTAVLNAASSGALTMNLQFSSSAELQPMSNTSLKTTDNIEGTATGAKFTNAAGKDADTSISKVGDTISLNATIITPGTTSDEKISSVVWSSSDASIASISGTSGSGNATATIKGNALGDAKISAIITTDRGNVYVATQTVNVLDPAKTYYITNDGASITTLSLSTNEAEETATLGYELNPLKNSTTIYGTKWTIESGNDVIELGAATGATTTVTAKKAGTATVKLTLATKQTEGGDADFTTGIETVSVTVTVTTPATAVEASLDSVVSTPNGNSVVTLSLPNGTNDPVDSITGIVAASGDKSIATVSVDSTNKQLNITGVKNGTAKIVAVVSTKNGAVLTKVITVTVETPTLNLPATLNAEGNTVNASVDGTTDAIESVAWESSNTDVATVDASGTSTTVTASENASAQDVTITATVTYKGGATAVVSGTINVTYNAPVQTDP